MHPADVAKAFSAADTKLRNIEILYSLLCEARRDPRAYKASLEIAERLRELRGERDALAHNLLPGLNAGKYTGGYVVNRRQVKYGPRGVYETALWQNGALIAKTVWTA